MCVRRSVLHMPRGKHLAYRLMTWSLHPEGFDGIDARGAPRRDNACRESSDAEDSSRHCEEDWIERRRLIQLRRDHLSEREGCRQSDRESDDDRPHALIDHDPEDVMCIRAE